MTDTYENVRQVMTHCRTTENAHALVLCTTEVGRDAMVECFRQYLVEMKRLPGGDYVAQLDNFVGGKSNITVRLAK